MKTKPNENEEIKERRPPFLREIIFGCALLIVESDKDIASYIITYALYYL